MVAGHFGIARWRHVVIGGLRVQWQRGAGEVRFCAWRGRVKVGRNAKSGHGSGRCCEA